MATDNNNKLLALSVGEKSNRTLDYTQNNIKVGGVDYIKFSTIDELEATIESGKYFSIITIFDCEDSSMQQTNIDIAKSLSKLEKFQISLLINEEFTAKSEQIDELKAICKNSMVVDGAAIVNICDYTNGHDGDATIEGYIYRFIYLVYGSVVLNSPVNVDFADIVYAIDDKDLIGFASLDGKGDDLMGQFLGLLEIVRFSKSIEPNEEISVIASIEGSNTMIKMEDIYKILGSINSKFGDNCNIIWSLKDNSEYTDTLALSILVSK
ncbi:MAG: hypothetical protein R3Y50_03365 [Rikenellaceae bacterium]